MEPGKYQQCKRCVMDTTDSAIEFDRNGYCNHCTGYFEKTAVVAYQEDENKKKLASLVEKMKISGRNSKYDCLLGISGGIDSCYAACIIKKLGLRALIVHLDNGWDSDTSVKNIKHTIDKIGFDYESYVLNWEDFKDLQLSFLKASVPEIETPTDIAIPAALHKIASKHKIKFIISGGNLVTEGILPESWHYNAKDLTYLRSIHRQFGSGKLNKFPLFGYKQEIAFKYIHGIRTIYLLNYIPFSKKAAIKFLEENLDWKYYGGKHYESIYTRFVQSYILPEKFNIDYRKATFSTQICAGEITREAAMEDLNKLPYDPVKAELEKSYFCKKLGISLDEFERIMDTPVKTYRDYPNDQKKLEYIYKVYRKINNRK